MGSLGHSPFHPQRQEGSQGRGCQRAPFQPEVLNSSCPREPQATSPSVLWDLGAISIGTQHSPHSTAHPTFTPVLPSSTPHCGRGVGQAITTAPLAELPILMVPSSVSNRSLLSQCQARQGVWQAPKRGEELGGDELGCRGREGEHSRTVLQKALQVSQKPGWKGLALPQVCKKGTVTSCGKGSR